MTTRTTNASALGWFLSRLGWSALVILAVVGAYTLLAWPIAAWIANPVAATIVVGGVVAVVAGSLRLLRPQLLSYKPLPHRLDDVKERRFWIYVLSTLALTFLAGQAMAVTLYELVGSAGFDRHLEAEQGSGHGLVLLLSLVVAPLSEECLFRGLVYPLLRRRLSIVAAALITALLFASLHGNLVQAAATMPLGLVLALVAERTRGLWQVVVLHSAYNLAATLTPPEVVQAVAAPQYVITLTATWSVGVAGLFVRARSQAVGAKA